MKRIIIMLAVAMLIFSSCGCNCEKSGSDNKSANKDSVDGKWKCTKYEEETYTLYIDGETAVLEVFGNVQKGVVDTKAKTITFTADGKTGVNTYELVSGSLLVTGESSGKSDLFERVDEDKEE